MLSKKLILWLCKQGAIEQKDQELYTYSLYCLFITIVPLLMALLVAVITGNIPQYIAILFPFMLLRQYSGGYHAKKAWICMFASWITLSLVVCLAKAFPNGFIHWLLVIISAISIYINSPIDSPNRRLTKHEKIMYHNKLKYLLPFFLLTEAGIDWIGFNEISTAMGLGIILVAITQLPCIVHQYSYK